MPLPGPTWRYPGWSTIRPVCTTITLSASLCRAQHYLRGTDRENRPALAVSVTSAHDHLPSWKMMPRVWRSPVRMALTPWRMLTR